jgi:hypothetical protein
MIEKFQKPFLSCRAPEQTARITVLLDPVSSSIPGITPASGQGPTIIIAGISVVLMVIGHNRSG